MAVKKPPVYNPAIPPSSDSDPSSLTYQLVSREVAAIKELLQQDIKGIKAGIDVAHRDKERVPTEIQGAVGNAQILFDTKIYYEHKLAKAHLCFIEKRLKWMEILRVEQKHDLKELADKNERAASKQVDQLADLVNRGLGNLNDKIGDQKDRFTVSDSTSKGKTLGIAQVISVVVAVATIVGIAVGMVMKYLAAAGK